MAYPPYQSDRRSRSRRWLLIALSLTVVVVLIGLLASRQTDQRGTVEFFVAAEEASVLQESAAQTFGQALASIGIVSRQDLTRRLETVVEKTAEAEGLVTAVENVPSDVGPSYGTMLSASTSWSTGAEEIDRVVIGIMDGEIVKTAVPELQHALDLLGVGDVAYELYMDSGAEMAEPVDLASFPSIRFVDPKPEDPTGFDATSLVLRIQAAYGLAPHHDASISGSTEPGAVGDRDGIPVVPFSESISIIALVTNEGNEPESGVDISLTVINVATGDVVSRTEIVPQLDVGTSTTVNFDGIEIEPGGLYQANLTARINGDIDETNNDWTMTFDWNAES
ncbi:MAG: hypothetical protein ABFR53_02875 [Actinomycetota bacterium]